MSSKKVKITPKIQTQLLDLIKFTNLNKVNIKGNEIISDLFDIERSKIELLSKEVTEWTFSFMLDFISITPQQKNKIEKLHFDVVKQTFINGKSALTVNEREKYINGIKDDFGYDLSSL